MNAKNRPWGQPEEVGFTDIPPAKRSKWWHLYLDASARLEQTKLPAVIKYPMASQAAAIRAADNLRKTFEARMGKDCVVVLNRADDDGRPALWIHRGEKYPTSRDSRESLLKGLPESQEAPMKFDWFLFILGGLAVVGIVVGFGVGILLRSGPLACVYVASIPIGIACALLLALRARFGED